jgi:hypothetical protein
MVKNGNMCQKLGKNTLKRKKPSIGQRRQLKSRHNGSSTSMTKAIKSVNISQNNTTKRDTMKSLKPMRLRSSSTIQSQATSRRKIRTEPGKRSKILRNNQSSSRRYSRSTLKLLNK